MSAERHTESRQTSYGLGVDRCTQGVYSTCMDTTTDTTAVTALGQREQEARRIARAEGVAIVDASADWTFFSLDDGQVVKYEWDKESHTIRTHFEWTQDNPTSWGRFEGFVS